MNLLNPSWLGMGLFQRKLIREFREFKSVRKGKQINSLCPSISAFFFKQVLIGDHEHFLFREINFLDFLRNSKAHVKFLFL